MVKVTVVERAKMGANGGEAVLVATVAAAGVAGVADGERGQRGKARACGCMHRLRTSEHNALMDASGHAGGNPARTSTC